MTTIRRIFLAHAVTSAPGYRKNLERVRLLELGAIALDPGAHFLRDVGRTPDDDPASGHVPAPDRCDELARRLICGDEREHRGGPQGIATATTCLPPTSCVWVVSPPCPEIAERVGWAEAAGVPVCVLDAAEQEVLLARGLGCLRELRPAECVATSTSPAGEDEAGPFRSPQGVIWAWANGAAEKLDARATPLPSGSGGGGCGCAAADAFRGRLEIIGLKLAAAEGVLQEARRDGERWLGGAGGKTDRLLLAIYRDGLCYQDAAAVSGMGGAMAAWRRHEAALGAIAAALRTINERNELLRAERERGQGKKQGQEQGHAGRADDRGGRRQVRQGEPGDRAAGHPGREAGGLPDGAQRSGPDDARGRSLLARVFPDEAGGCGWLGKL